MPQPFNKPATTYAQQIALLRQRGMSFDDVRTAEFYLQHLSYYRLGAYWPGFEADHSTHRFKANTRFEDVLNLYIFDRELRLLVLDAIERVEVSARAQWTYHLGNRHGAHAHLDASLFNSQHWAANKDQLVKEVARSEERFIVHHKNTYTEELPPVWAVSEVMSLGTLSKWYASLMPKSTRNAISRVYGIDDLVLASWLRHISGVRNTCAHHSRLWNRSFIVTPKIPRSKSGSVSLSAEFVPGSRKIYNTMVILAYLMDIISPENVWRLRLKHIVDVHEVTVTSMDFPVDWLQRPIWQ